MRPPRQTGLYVDYVEKAGLVDYCTVQQDDDLLGPHEWYKIWTCDMYALVLLLVAEILQRLVPHAVFQCILGDGRFESSTVAMVPSTRAGLNRKPQIHFKLTHSQHVRVVVVTARALANWAMIYPTSQTLGEFCAWKCKNSTDLFDLIFFTPRCHWLICMMILVSDISWYLSPAPVVMLGNLW